MDNHGQSVIARLPFSSETSLDIFDTKIGLAAVFIPHCAVLLNAALLRLDEIITVEVHYLVPGRDKIVYEFLLGIVTSVDFSNSPELGV